MKQSTRNSMAVGGLGSLMLAMLLMVCPAWGQPSHIAVRFDPATTQIGWTLKGIPHATHGTFRLKGGLISFDPATGVAQGELLVELASGESGNKKRDAKMQAEVLESGKYPQAFFHPIKILGKLNPGSAQSLEAEGTFNIHGSDHPLKLTLRTEQAGSRVTATTRFSVPYVAWGMKDPSSLLLRVGKEVSIDVIAHGTMVTDGVR